MFKVSSVDWLGAEGSVCYKKKRREGAVKVTRRAEKLQSY